MADDRIPLSTAAIVSARFPYLTPAGRIGYSGGDYVDGGYFENSGTYLLSGSSQYLIGEQASYPAGKDPQLDAARKAVFVVIVIESEPCTRDSTETGCDEDATSVDGSWNEALSPLRALLSTRDMRAEYSLDGLNAVSALIEQFSAKNPGQPNATDTGTGMRLSRLRRHAPLPQSHPHRHPALLGAFERGPQIDGQRRRRHGNGDVRAGPPPREPRNRWMTRRTSIAVLGSYRRVFCMLATRSGEQGCAQTSQAAAPQGIGPAPVQKSVSK